MEQTVSRPKKGITGTTLKIIAIVTMFIDHIGAGLIEPVVFHLPDVDAAFAIIATPVGAKWYLVDQLLRLVGRISFPIFCFLLVEGFLHTHDVKKYAFRLFLFALISEVPFDLTFIGSAFNPNYQNVYFTLLIGLLVLVGYQRYMMKPVIQTLVMVAGCAAAVVLRTDYSMMGVLLILVLYVFRFNKKYQIIAGGIMSAIESFANLGAAALAFIPIHMYNGEKGRQNLKYFFYWFYPVHILLIYVVRVAFF